MFRVVFKFVLAVICAGSLVTLAVACGGGEDGPPPTPFTGDWSQFDDTDPITDEGHIGIRLYATDDDVDAGLFGVWLYVRCTDAKDLDVYVVWHQDVGEELVVDWRVDSDDPERKLWYPTTNPNNETTFHPEPKSAVSDLSKAEKISVRVYSISLLNLELLNLTGEEDENAMTAVFHPSGFEDAYKPVEKACQ